jgi:hypothetical protein
MNFGIDKLKLQSNDFKVANAKGIGQFNTRGGKIDELNPYLLTTKEGQDIFECGIHTNIDIGQANLNIAINQTGMALTFNPSKHKHPYYLEGIGHLPKVKEDIQVALNNLGIDCALESFKLSRIDITKQVESKRNYIGYKGAMELISDTITGNKQINKFSTTDTFQKGKSLQNQFYDKGQELRKHKLFIQEKNLIRCETKLLLSESCQKLLGKAKGINYFEDLMNWDNEELNAFQNEVLSKELFDRTKTLQLQNGIDIDQLIYQIMKIGKANFVKVNGYTNIVEQYSIDTWLQIQKVINPNITRQGISNEKSKIEKAYQMGLMLQSNRETTKQELLFDLRKEFIDNFRVA